MIKKIITVIAISFLVCDIAFAEPVIKDVASVTEPTHERFDVRIKKLYTITDGDYRFQAFVVEWNGGEVVVESGPGFSDYKEGDLIQVLVVRWKDKSKPNRPGKLSFIKV